MEKVLRKVSVKDRNPLEEGYYMVQVGDFKTILGTFFNGSTFENYHPNMVWYEEVSLEDIKDISYNDGFSTAKKVLYEIELQEAKERYEKALTYVLQSRDMMRMPRQILNEEMYKALRMAAGLEEDDKV